MLEFVTFPTAALAFMTPEEVVAMLVLQAHADKTGKSWPTQKTMARVTTMSEAAMQRAVIKLEEDDLITRRRRFARSTVYQVAERFRKKPHSPASEAHSPASAEQKGLPKKEDSEVKPKEDAPVRRFAPPPRRVQQPNPFARRLWLRKVNTFASERLSGQERMLAWELVAKAEAGALIDRAERRQLDDIDRAMRACGYGSSSMR